MFYKEIEFSTHKDYFSLKEDLPVPIKLNIPDWYKKLKDDLINGKTIKSCIPFLDTLTTGYLLKIPQDFLIRHNVLNNQGKKDSFQSFGLQEMSNFINAKMINLNTLQDVHPPEQLGESPYVEKNKNLPFYKILNPWKIKTPSGYSCLFIPPLNNSDDRFSIIPGIVDTDVFPNEVNFPIVLNGDKYPVLETILKKGTPYVQIIPFKRDNWKMILKEKDEEEIKNSRIFWSLNLIGRYKNKIWKKKSWT